MAGLSNTSSSSSSMVQEKLSAAHLGSEVQNLAREKRKSHNGPHNGSGRRRRRHVPGELVAVIDSIELRQHVDSKSHQALPGSMHPHTLSNLPHRRRRSPSVSLRCPQFLAQPMFDDMDSTKTPSDDQKRLSPSSKDQGKGEMQPRRPRSDSVVQSNDHVNDKSKPPPAPRPDRLPTPDLPDAPEGMFCSCY